MAESLCISKFEGFKASVIYKWMLAKGYRYGVVGKPCAA